jgi:hypothetical protein
MNLLKLVRPAEPPPVATAPHAPDAMVELIGERARIGAELRRFDPVTARRVEAEAALNAIDGEIRSLDAAETAAWTAWAHTPEGEAPARRHEARRALVTRRAEALSDVDAACVAEAAVQAPQLVLLAELRRVGAAIRALKIARAVEAAADLHREAERMAEQSGKPLMQIAGAREALAELMTSAGARGDTGAEAEFRAAIVQIDTLKPVAVLGDAETIGRHRAEWRRILE